MTTAPLKTFLIYAHEDSTAVDLLRKQLVSLEKSKSIELWFDGKILAGQKWDETIKHRLEQAELVLLCVSVDFINSDYIEDTELKKALQRHRDGLAHLVPIVLRPCDWVEYFQIGQLQALPHKARPVYSSNFPHPDEAFYEIQQGIKTLVADMLQKRAARQHAEEEAARVAEVEKNRAQRRQQLDDAAWQAARAEMDAADTGQDNAFGLADHIRISGDNDLPAGAHRALESLQGGVQVAGTVIDNRHFHGVQLLAPKRPSTSWAAGSTVGA